MQAYFAGLFHLTGAAAPRLEDFDELLADGETFTIGSLQAEALHTPGHTPACMAYRDRRCGVCRRHAVHARTTARRAATFLAATRLSFTAPFTGC